MPNSAATLYAKWTNSGGGHDLAFAFVTDHEGPEDWTLPSGQADLLAGQQVDLETGYTHDGWTFNGWFTDEAGIEPAPDPYTMPNTAATLYAKWTGNDYKVTYVVTGDVPNSYTAPSETTENHAGDTINVAVLPDTTTDWKGYSFAGWTYGVVYGGEGQPTSFTMPAEDVIITGVWTANAHTVHYIFKSASTVPETGWTPYDETHSFAQTVTLPAAPDIPGWTFRAWVYNNTELQPGATFTMPDEDVTISAWWNTPTAYNITFHAKDDVKPDSWQLPTIAAQYPGHVIDLSTISIPQYDAWTFNGWSYATGPIFTDEEAKSIIMPNGNLDLYANWAAGNTFTLSFDFVTGYEADEEWLPEAISGLTEDEPVVLTTEYNHAGWTFDGWYADNNGNTKVTSPYTMPASSTTLYAKWTPVNYNISYTIGHGENDNSNPDTYTVASLPITIADATPDAGYTFEGWTSVKLGITTAAKGVQIPENTTGEVDLTAVFTPINYAISYTVTHYTANTNPTTYTVADLPITIVAPELEPGYAFDGWTSAALEITEPQTTTTIPPGKTGPIDFVASVRPLDGTAYSITYKDGNEATLGTGGDLSGITGEQVTIPGITIVEGQVQGSPTQSFTGYAFDSTNANNVLYGTISGDGALSLVAYYKLIDYNLSYTIGHGETTTPTPTPTL
jgi:uncharacterized repeat protein (TIGR02543 family)